MHPKFLGGCMCFMQHPSPCKVNQSADGDGGLDIIRGNKVGESE